MDWMDSSGGRLLWHRRRQGNWKVCWANVTAKLRLPRKLVSATLLAPPASARWLFVLPTTLALVDLRSNSFRLQIGRAECYQNFQLDTWSDTPRHVAPIVSPGPF